MAESLLAAVRHCQDEAPVQSLLAAPHVQAEVNKLGPTGVNSLGLAVWRNHAGLVQALLEAGADPDMQDSESGWSALHRALHWGQLRIAAALLQANASLGLPDWRGRSPLDLLSAELKEYIEPGGDGDVFSWGNGSNYTLGTGSTDVQLHPARVESLHDQQVAAISAAKFHSAAVSVDGRLLTWGWGRGGRLGHPDAHIHSGEGAVIAPLVVSSLGRRAVAAVAAAKHHTVLCTTAGEVFTMGSNRHGQLGYAVDSQPTPRRVTSLRQRVVALAAANKHSVAVTAAGDVYTWGSNVLGQLGYGTSDSVSNAAPRLVEAMRGKAVVAAAAAKRHTLVLTASGEVYTWGHRGVSPRRVQLAGARDALSAEGAPITFHRGHADVARPVAAAICAGAAHSSALTSAGVVLTWRSADPALQVQEVGGTLAGKRVVSVAAGKYRTAVVSDEGDVYMWEGRSDYFPAEGRQPGSGSKKPSSGSATKARPIPGGAGGGGMRISLGGEAPLGSRYGAAECGTGSYGSHTRRPGSYIERFAREREASAVFGTSPAAAGAPGSSYGVSGSASRPELSFGSGTRPSRASDVFERVRPERVEGLKRAAAVAVGEKHSLAVQRWSAAQLEGMVAVPWLHPAPAAAASVAAAAADDDRWFQQAADADSLMDGGQLATPRGLEAEPSSADSPASMSPGRPSPVRPGPRRSRAAEAAGVPSLQRICEEEVARRLVDPRTCLPVLEYADVAGAEVLRAYCLAVAVCNLDAVLLEAGGAFEELAPHLLGELERLFKLRLAGAGASGSSAQAAGGAAAAAGALDPEPAGPAASEEGAAAEAGSKQRQEVPQPGSLLQPGRRPTAAAPWLGDEGVEVGGLWASGAGLGFQPMALAAGGSSFRDRSQADAEAATQRLLRTLQKKLQQIEHLEAKAAGGAALDPQQQAKVQQKPVIQSAAAALEGGMALDDVQSILRAAAAGREPEAALGLGSGGGSSNKAAGAAATAPASVGKQAKSRGKKGCHKPDAVAGDGSSSAAPVAAAASDAEPFLAAEASGSLLGSSPPSSSLVPAFGPAGSAAAPDEQPRTPAAATEPPSAPVGQVRSLVGFASCSASDGVGAAAQRQSGQQLPAGARPSGGGSSKPKSASKRKGGLSMFLRGELEQDAAAAEPAAGEGTGGGTPMPAPAWGAKAAAPAGAASLKQILDQEAAGMQQQGPAAKPPSAQRSTPGSGIKARAALDSPSAAAVAAAAAGGPLRMSLATFMHSSPMPAQRRDNASPPPAAWGGTAGSSPPSRQASFRAIQQEQEALLPATKAFGTSPPAVQRLAGGLPPWRPPQAPASSAGAAGPSASLLGASPSASGSLLGTSPSGRGASFLAAPVPQHSKWYVPEESRADLRKSLKSIQTEEEAMAVLAKQYGSDNVKIAGKPKAANPKPGMAPGPGPDLRRTSPGLPRPGGKQQGRQDSGSKAKQQDGGGKAGGGKQQDGGATAGGGKQQDRSGKPSSGGRHPSRGGRHGVGGRPSRGPAKQASTAPSSAAPAPAGGSGDSSRPLPTPQQPQPQATHAQA